MADPNKNKSDPDPTIGINTFTYHLIFFNKNVIKKAEGRYRYTFKEVLTNLLIQKNNN